MERSERHRPENEQIESSGKKLRLGVQKEHS